MLEVAVKRLRLREVGLREAIQSDTVILATKDKISLGRDLARAGFRFLNAVAFVNPKVMPQMADAEDVLAGLSDVNDVVMSGLVPNARGLERALSCVEKGTLHEIHLLTASSASVLRANGLDLDVMGGVDHVLALAREAKTRSKVRVVTFISASFGCSIEGRIEEDTVIRIASRLAESALVDQIVISDSTGQATPLQVRKLLPQIYEAVGDTEVCLHLHDSRGAATANILAALDAPRELLTIDCGIGGLGGDIPFIPEAAGNVASEDVVSMLHGMGIETGIDESALIDANRRLTELYPSRPLSSHMPIVGPRKWSAA